MKDWMEGDFFDEKINGNYIFVKTVNFLYKIH